MSPTNQERRPKDQKARKQNELQKGQKRDFYLTHCFIYFRGVLILTNVFGDCFAITNNLLIKRGEIGISAKRFNSGIDIASVGLK